MTELPYRQIHMDFHTSPYIDNVGERFNAEEFASVLRKAKVNSINLFAKCHHGMYYYPTKIGTMHPNLKFDLLGAQMEVCRKAGIRTCIYTTVVWNEDWADRHPEWLHISTEGVLGVKKPFSSDFYGWRSICLNNREHMEYLKLEFQETYSLYKPDGYWIDIVFQSGCICRTCMKEMQEMGLNPKDSGDLAKHGRHVEIKFMKEIYEFLKQMDPELDIFFNGWPNEMDLADDEKLSARQKRKYNSYIDMESLPSDLWGYTHFPIQVNYLNKYDQELTMMNGKFHKAWGDFGSLRNIEALEYECFRAIANGAKVCVGDQLHPSGQIDRSVYQRIGEVFESIEKKEKWCHGTKKVSQIGVYSPNRVLGAGDAGANASSEGVYRMLTELHHLFDFVDFKDDINAYELIILPDSIQLSGDVQIKLEKYINSGGKVLLTGKSGLNERGDGFASKDFGVEFISDAEYNPRYVNIVKEPFSDTLPMDYVMYEQGVSVRALPGTEVLAYITNPYFNRTWDRFCSHRQTPPAGVTEEPCIVKKGDIIYVSNPLFKDYAINGCKVYKDIIRTCLNILIKKPFVQCDLPVTAEATLRKQEGGYILHILNYIIQRKCRTLDIIEEKLPLFNKKISIRTERKPEKVYLVPQMEELEFIFDGEFIHLEVPKIEGHQMIAMNF